MNDIMARNTIGGAALGSGSGGALAWLIGSLLLGLAPLVFLAFGVYTGAVYGAIVAALRTASARPTYRLATINRAPAS